EIKIVFQIAELRYILAHIGTRIGASVRARVNALSTQANILDEFEIRVKAQRLVVNEPVLGIRADDQPRHAQPISILIYLRRRDMIVKPAPIIPRQENRRTLPRGSLH